MSGFYSGFVVQLPHCLQPKETNSSTPASRKSTFKHTTNVSWSGLTINWQHFLQDIYAFMTAQQWHWLEDLSGLDFDTTVEVLESASGSQVNTQHRADYFSPQEPMFLMI